MQPVVNKNLTASPHAIGDAGRHKSDHLHVSNGEFTQRLA